MEHHFHASKPKIDASVTLPSSKSISHRALIAAALASGTSKLYGISKSKDIEATINVLQHLGVHFEMKDDVIVVEGCGGNLHYDQAVLDCNESGSTLRFMIPIVALLCDQVTFTGHGRLMQRPQSVYEKLFKENGLYFKQDQDLLEVQGPLQANTYTIQGNISSQFITGLLFALPLCQKDSMIHVIEPFESRSYVLLTLDTLHKAGISCKMQGNDIFIHGNQTYQPIHTRIEGDASQMAFFALLASIHACAINVFNVNHDSHQGDAIIIDIVRKIGCEVEEIEGGYRFIGKEKKATTISLADCPDLGPALFALATQCKGKTIFTDCERLRMKESDRIEAMEIELRKLGCHISSHEGEVEVIGPSPITSGVTLYGHNDHRIVMALSMLASVANDITLEGCEAVEKSYPSFFEDLRKIGVQYD